VSELFLYDDSVARAFEPFALTRPASELRAGALLLRERWEHALGRGGGRGGRGERSAGVVTSAHLSDFDEPWSVPVVSGALPKGSVVANSRCAVALSPIAKGAVFRCGDSVAAVTLGRDVEAEELASGKLALESLAPKGARTIEIQGRWIEHVWEFIVHLSPMLNEDVPVLAKGGGRRPSRTGSSLAGAIVGGEHGVCAEDGAVVEPQVYFDTTAGPVLIRRGATVQAFTRIVGPCVVGMESLVGGDKISGSSIGETCKIHGEMSATILIGHSNKGHDGYVGHSYFGRWVNLGAGTITSNLKNTYGTVQLWTPDGLRDTGLQFLGTFFGDHAKTGIGTMLNTGTVIGAGANVYGGETTPKAIPPFAWGERPPYSTYRMDKFIEVARRMMARRHVDLTDRQIRLLNAAFERRWSDASR
jgi:UDP-N-acetylglucosamine diphosphorylase/glucosamine-1-phosphate N-acetyltransferase